MSFRSVRYLAAITHQRQNFIKLAETLRSGEGAHLLHIVSPVENDSDTCGRDRM